MTIDFKSLRIVPVVIMFIIATHVAISFNDVEMHLASYLSLGLTLLSFVVTMFLTMRIGSVTRLLMFTMFFMILILTLSLVNGLAWKEWIYITLTVATLMLVFQYYKDCPKALLTGAVIGFSISVYAQFLQCVLHPDLWMFENDKSTTGYLLGGNYNAIGCRLITAILTGILALKISKWWWLNLVPLVVSGLGIMFMVKSMTSLVSIIMLLALCMISGKKKLIRMACYGIFAGVIFFELFVCFQGKGFENNELARWFLIDVLGKDMTFTYRTRMWDSALQTIAETPIWGWGYPDEHWFYSYMSSFAYGTHNFILGMLVYGGVIGLALYCYIFYLGFSKLLKHNDYYSNVIFSAMAVLHIMMLMENYPVEFPLYFITLAYYYDYIYKSIRKCLKA